MKTQNGSSMRKSNTVEIESAVFQQLARYEISIQQVLNGKDKDNIINKDNYTVTLEDLFCAIQRFVMDDISTDTFFDEWFCYFYDVFSDIKYTSAENTFYNRSIVLKENLEQLYYGIYYYMPFEPEKILTDIQIFLEDEQKPLAIRRYPDYAKLNLIKQLEIDRNLNNASEEIAALYKLFAEELCEKGIKEGLLAVGYGCYGGNRVFSCDWKRAENCMLKLFDSVEEIPDRAFYANTLGYIYYYGRTNSAIPEYEKAYKYFSYAAFNGIFEAEYKIADMYRNGYGVPKCQKTSNTIVARLYSDNIKYIVNGCFDSKFADIAFRMGNICTNEDNYRDINYDDALYYYYQALFAIRMRMKDCNYYGDNKVADAIRSAIERVKDETDFKISNKIELLSLCGVFQDFLAAGCRLTVTTKIMSNGKIKFIFKPCKKHNKIYPNRLFITIPELDMCGYYDSLTVIAKPYPNSKAAIPEHQFTVDEIDFDAFYHDETPVFIANQYSFIIKKNKNSETKYRFASVEFTAGGKTYDYRSDDTTIHIGDRITVNADGTNKDVRVVNIFEKTESEILLPLKCYKFI